MATSFTETFSQVARQELVKGQPVKTSGGIDIMLDSDNGKPCGIRATKSKDTNELVIGGGSNVDIYFGRMVKDLSIDYYVTLDYEDEKVKSRNLKDVTTLALDEFSGPSLSFTSSIGQENFLGYWLATTAAIKTHTVEGFNCDYLSISAYTPLRMHLVALRWNNA